MPNSGPGGCTATRVMTIFGAYVEPHFPNIEDFGVYEGIRCMKVHEGI